MFDQHFLSSAAPADVFGPLRSGERMMWRGRCAVAEYAFDEAASLPRWTLPEATDVLVTDHRVRYAYTSGDGHRVRSGELRWLWPQHLRVQPGRAGANRGRAATQIQLVCGGADGTYPALVFAGGDLATVGHADRLANVIRQAIARYRVDHADTLGLSTGQVRMLSRLLIGPEFRNHQDGAGQTVSMLGAMLVQRPAPAPAFPATIALVEDESAAVSFSELTVDLDEVTALEDRTVGFDARTTPFGGTTSAHVEAARAVAARAEAARAAAAGSAGPTEEVAQPFAEGARLIRRPGMAADAVRALMAARAEQATQRSEPAPASRAADVAARMADLVTRAAAPERRSEDRRPTGATEWRMNWADEPRMGRPAAHRTPAEPVDVPTTTNLAERAEAIRRTAARMASNSARTRAGMRRADLDTGAATATPEPA